ncbi:Thioredoxin domain-containing protein [Hyella patelloides LEGE 07179]|uniref:Thioredoxin domain-containing protein n=1 Tax=Hyella patelloides LEGE 07179 TaxID=945734 RepID=A0A563W5N1_9CYAN|nr:thioredoxin domain-containing protein [Hyella patelloides]VEP18974.1 Thioredoxin domain-containing protein [Hyella patelloides LEGE 07179]
MNLKKIFISLAIVFTLAINLLISSPAEALGGSPLSGLIALKNLAKNATPYEDAVTNGKPTLLEFYADWCTTCQGMSSTIEQLEAQYGDRINLVMLDIDDPQWDDLGQKYKVTGIPQYNFLDAEEHKVESFIGQVPQRILAQTFEQLIDN